MAKHLLTKWDESRIVSLRLQGYTHPAIGNLINCSPKVTARVVRDNASIMNAFEFDPETKELRLLENVTLDGDLINCGLIAITGDHDDGVLEVNSSVASSDGMFVADETKTSLYIDSDVTFYVGAIVDKSKGETVDDVVFDDEEIEVIEEKTPKIVWQGSNKFVTIDDGTDTYHADNTHQHFIEILGCCVAEEFERAISLMNTKRALEIYASKSKLVTIENGVLRYKGIELKSGLAKRIVDDMRNGEDFERYIPFLEKLMLNPSRSAVYRLFDFLCANDIEITDDGDIIAWRSINRDWTDRHTGTYDNSITGIPVSMPRNEVDDNDSVTCSYGFHACSFGYLKHFRDQNSRTIRVKIHPKDVVSIPIDYNDMKMRICEYLVIEEYLGEI